MKYIALSQGKQAIIDDKDYSVISSMRWFYHAGYAAGYVKNQDGVKTKIWMHRFINDTPSDLDTDHINRDKLDNRRKNLRPVTVQQNAFNRGKKGYRKVGNRWHAYIAANNHQKHLGTFSTEKDAKIAREIALREFLI